MIHRTLPLVTAATIAIALGTGPHRYPRSAVSAAVAPTGRRWPRYGGTDRTVTSLDSAPASACASSDSSDSAGCGPRWTFSLNLDPDFDSMDPTFRPPRPSSAAEDKGGETEVRVPSCFDAAPPGIAGPRGVGMYRTTFGGPRDPSKAARLHFEACSFYCRVFVDGEEIGDHRSGGYVPFYLDVPPARTSGDAGGSNNNATAAGAGSRRELFVVADNRFNATTAPMHTGGDFWHFGGLMRSVSLHELPARASASAPKDGDGGDPAARTTTTGTQPPTVWRAEILPNDVTDPSLPRGTGGEYTVNVTVVLSDDTYDGWFNFSLVFDDDEDDSGSSGSHHRGRARGGRVETLSFVPVPGATNSSHLWNLWNVAGGGDGPVLHTLSVVDGTPGRDAVVTERFGLRTWGVDAPTGRLTLNGPVVKLHGWNHHTQWPDKVLADDDFSVTASPTDGQMDEDVRQLLEAGTNFVRGAHYPQDGRWLDRLDEAGVAVWSETLGPGVSVADLTDPAFVDVQLSQLDEMMDDAINHPAVFAWGWFNEGPTEDADACPAYGACADRARSRDPTRFVTWADSHALGSKCLQFATLVAFNSYPAWYGHFGDLSRPAAYWREMARGVRAQFPTKPFIISETGAGGIYEWDHNGTDAKWTTRYQVEVIERDVGEALTNANVSGISLWHYFDFKGDDVAQRDCGQCDYLPFDEAFPPICGYVNASCDRPGGMNHKGVVDFWRRKKESWGAVASWYNGERGDGVLAGGASGLGGNSDAASSDL